jgi:hypothetical protein
MSELSKFFLSLLPLMVIPLLVGTAAFGPRLPVAIRWFFGMISLGLILTVAYSLGISWGTFFYAFGIGLVGCALLLLKQGVKRLGKHAWPNIYRAGVGFFLLILLGCAYVKVFAEPLEAWDAVVIWFNKARDLYQGTPISQLHFVNYPPLGPMYWAFVMKFTGGLWESYGRLLFPTMYFFWMLALPYMFPKCIPAWIFLIVIPGLGWLFFDMFAFTSGYQDGFVTICAGMAAIHLCKTLLEDKRRRQTDYLLALYFAGTDALVKNEGAVLAMILYTAWFLTLIVTERHNFNWKYLRSLIPGGMLFLLLLSIWPGLLIYHGQDPSQVQGPAFTINSIANSYENIDRLPMIKDYFVEHYFHPQTKTILSCTLLSIITAALVPITTRVMVFLWVTALGHILFMVLVYLATGSPLEWHLTFSLKRLAFHHSFAYVIILCISLCCLLEITFYRRALTKG